MNQIPKPSRLAALIRESVILSFLFRLADYLYDAAAHSVIGSLLSAYRADQCKTEHTMTYRMLNSKRFSIKNRILLPWKRFCNKTVQESTLLSLSRRIVRMLLDLPVRFYGTILFSFGLYTAALDLLLRYGFEQSGFASHDTITGLLIAMATFPLLFGMKPLSESLGASAVMHFLLCTVLGYRPQSLRSQTAPKGRTGTALILGVLLSLLTVSIPILSILGLIGFLIGAVIILYSPEIGVILIFAAVPFLPTMQLCALVIFTILSFCIKLAQGKRSLSFELLDYAVLGFLFFLFAGGFFSLSPADSIKPALLMTCLIGTYFLVISTVRTTAMAKRCVGVILFSASAEGLIGVLEAMFGSLSTQWQDLTLFADIGGRIVGTLENPNVLGEYLILTLPFLFALLALQEKASSRLGILLLIGISGSALILTWSRGAWLGLICGMLVYALLNSRKALTVLIGCVPILPLIALILPGNILSRLLSIGNLADTSTAYRLNIWRGSLAMAGDHLLGGIGTGINTFAAIYPNYALEGIEAAPHSHNLFLEILIEHGLLGLLLFLLVVFLFMQSCITYLRSETEPRERPMRLYTTAGLCAVLAFLVQGMTDYVWYNYRIFGMFWMLLALVSAFRRCAAGERTLPTADEGFGNPDPKFN